MSRPRLRTRRAPRRWIPCKTCHSLGTTDLNKVCPVCRGYGQIWVAD